MRIIVLRFEVDWIKTQGEIAHRHRRLKNRDPNKTQYVWATRSKHNYLNISTNYLLIIKCIFIDDFNYRSLYNTTSCIIPCIIYYIAIHKIKIWSIWWRDEPYVNIRQRRTAATCVQGVLPATPCQIWACVYLFGTPLQEDTRASCATPPKLRHQS